jgi:20S proteasome alpha/beta subunit
MEVLLGITGKDFTIIASSKAAMRGPTILKATDDKTRALNKHNLMAYSGEAGDTGTLAPSGYNNTCTGLTNIPYSPICGIYPS